MNLTCDQVKLRLLEGATPAPELRAHLNACPDCQEYHEVLRRIAGQQSEAEPSARLDEAILAYARRQVAARQARPALLRYVNIRVAAAVLAVAAAVAIAVVGVRLLTQSAAPPPVPPPPVAYHGEPNAAHLVQPPKAVVAVVDQFRWDDDPISDELARIEADVVLSTMDDRHAEIVGQVF